MTNHVMHNFAGKKILTDENSMFSFLIIDYCVLATSNFDIKLHGVLKSITFFLLLEAYALMKFTQNVC